MNNQLPHRKPMIVDGFYHRKAMILKTVILGKLTKMHKTIPEFIFQFGFRTPFGNGKTINSLWHCLGLDCLDCTKKNEPKNWLARFGLRGKKAHQENREKSAEASMVQTISRNKDSVMAFFTVIVQNNSWEDWKTTLACFKIDLGLES